MFPIAEKCAQQILSLPIYPEMKEEEVEEIAKQLAVILRD